MGGQRFQHLTTHHQLTMLARKSRQSLRAEMHLKTWRLWISWENVVVDPLTKGYRPSNGLDICVVTPDLPAGSQIDA